jgi:hypothetical protein
MAQRQFRSDDTSKWKLKFGDGRDGDLTIAANTIDVPIDSTCSGTIDSTILTATNADFEPGQAVLIHKTRGDTNAICGSWELNEIKSYAIGTINLKYPLCNTYTSSGADCSQVIVLKQYENVTVNSGITWTTKSWNGTTGGILAFLCKETTQINGTIIGTGTNGASYLTSTSGNTVGGGFYGGRGTRSESSLQTGEGTLGAPKSTEVWMSNSPYGSAGTIGAGSGGGGANANAGETGYQQGGSYGTPSVASGNFELTLITFGGGGGGSGGNEGASNGAGGSGGSIVWIASKITVITGNINLKGGDGGSGTTNNWVDDPMGGGGGGAGGSLLIKGEEVDYGNNLLNLEGGSYGLNNNRRGGAGSVGRINIDYSKLVAGVSTPISNLRLDKTIKSQSSSSTALLLNLLP